MKNTGGISRRLGVLLALAGVLAVTAGCTSRGMTVTSNPPGAEVSINRRVVGVTPIRVGFMHYGSYRIEMRKRGYQTLVKEENIRPGLYGYDPAAFVADNLVPARLNDEIYLHYVLTPLEQKTDRAALMERAELARTGSVTHPKTGEQITVNINRKPGEVPTPAASDTGTPPTPPVAGTEQPPTPPPPAEADRVPGLTIAEQYGLETTPQPKPRSGDFEAPDKKAAGPLRIPKDEELIYDQPAPAKAEEKPAAAPTKPAVSEPEKSAKKEETKASEKKKDDDKKKDAKKKTEAKKESGTQNSKP